jgi:hypothetical protein
VVSISYSAVARMGKQVAAVMAASYWGAIFGLGLYPGWQMFGHRLHEIFGAQSVILGPAWMVVLMASVLGCVLASYFGVYAAGVFFDAGWRVHLCSLPGDGPRVQRGRAILKRIHYFTIVGIFERRPSASTTGPWLRHFWPSLDSNAG